MDAETPGAYGFIPGAAVGMGKNHAVLAQRSIFHGNQGADGCIAKSHML